MTNLVLSGAGPRAIKVKPGKHYWVFFPSSVSIAITPAKLCSDRGDAGDAPRVFQHARPTVASQTSDQLPYTLVECCLAFCPCVQGFSC